MQLSFDGCEPASLRPKSHARLGTPAFRKAGEDRLLLPSALDEEIPEGHPVRMIKWAVQHVDLSAIRKRYEHKGGIPYPPANLLAVLLFGMTEGIRSSRGLEERCRYDLRYRFLMDGLMPDDRTFGRFLERIDPISEEVFGSFNALLQSKGMCKVRGVGVDGVKTQGSSSWWKHQAASDSPPSDPEACKLYSHGRHLVGYNAQFAVDLDEGTIAGVAVVCEQNDFHAIPAVIEAVERQSGSIPCSVVADAGYDSCDNIETLESKGIDSVIDTAKPIPPEVAEDAEGVLRCPVGRKIVLTGHRTFGEVTHDYYRPEGGCKGCPLRAQCGFKGKNIQVPSGADVGARFRNRARLESAMYSGAMRSRRTVERVFAIRNHCDKFGRILRRGALKALTELTLWAASFNLRVWASIAEALFRRFLDLFGASLAGHITVGQSVVHNTPGDVRLAARL
jgi:transposase